MRGRWMAGMLLSLWAAVALAGDLEEELARRWVGAWVVVLPEVASDCSGFYTNTEVRGRLAASKGRHRFQAGELAQVDKLKLASGRVDLYLTLAETLLVPRREGPFELFDERTCKVQLMVEVPREVVHARRVEGVMEVLASAAVAFPTRAEAEGSPQWNGRRRAAYPADYELTLAQYAAWKAEQENARVSEVRERAADAAAAVVGRLSDDPSYLAGLAAGVEALRSFRPASCALLGTMSFSAAERPAPREHAGDTPEAKAWRRGFRDGQELAYSLALLREARNCFVPVPPVPPAP